MSPRHLGPPHTSVHLQTRVSGTAAPAHFRTAAQEEKRPSQDRNPAGCFLQPTRPVCLEWPLDKTPEAVPPSTHLHSGHLPGRSYTGALPRAPRHQPTHFHSLWKLGKGFSEHLLCCLPPPHILPLHLQEHKTGKVTSLSSQTMTPSKRRTESQAVHSSTLKY